MDAIYIKKVKCNCGGNQEEVYFHTNGVSRFLDERLASWCIKCRVGTKISIEPPKIDSLF